MLNKRLVVHRSFFLALVCIFTITAFNAIAQKPAPKPSTLVNVSIDDDGATSELPFIPIAGPVGVKDAQFSAMYFGPQSDSDISLLILAKFQRPRYGGKRTFAVKFLIDETNLSKNLRLINRVVADEDGESLQFSITTEELAWLVLGDRLEITVYDGDSQQKLDTYRFTANGLKELKSFAKSVLILRSYGPLIEK
jgi:hypothetical protein